MLKNVGNHGGLPLQGMKKIHLVGIGGAGMSGIAHVLLESGYTVSGSDMVKSEITRRLGKSGARICIGHRKENLRGVDLVIFSSAIPYENPELKFARSRNIPCRPRSWVLAEMMREKTGIAITGTHGKTTTTALISLILKKAGLDPTILVGGELDDINGNACFGKGEHLVVEADESDGSFLTLSPRFAVVTNIEDDHLDYYGDINSLMDAFTMFVDAVFLSGGIVCFSDHPNNLRLLKNRKKEWRKALVYGLGRDCAIRGENVEEKFGMTSFSIFCKGKKFGRVKLNLPGIYNVHNALAASAIAIALNIKFDVVRDVFSHYRGIERRFQIKGEVDNVLVVEDYAHHPTEIEVTLQAARKSGRRIVAVFQPHRYSRTAKLACKLGSAFGDADVLIVTDIYSAWEDFTGNISSETIVRAAKEDGHPCVCYIPDMQDIVRHVVKILKSGDMLLILGAGDINKVIQPIIKGLKKRKLLTV